MSTGSRRGLFTEEGIMQVQPVGAETLHGEDIIAIQDVVARFQDAQQGEDPEGFLALFQDDAVWVTAHGRRSARAFRAGANLAPER